MVVPYLIIVYYIGPYLIIVYYIGVVCKLKFEQLPSSASRGGQDTRRASAASVFWLGTRSVRFVLEPQMPVAVSRNLG